MTGNGLVFLQRKSTDLDIENLPDGSTAVFNSVTQTVHSLHPLAAAAFRACREQKNMMELREAMARTLGTAVSEASAMGAIVELERAGLVAVSESGEAEPGGASRRSVLTSALKAAGAAMPLVLSLTASEQSVFAQGVGSGTTTTTTTTTTTPAPTASLIGMEPNTVNGCSITNNVFIVGVNTHFSGSSVVSFSIGGITASNVVANSLTSLQLTITTNFGGGSSQLVTVTVTTGGEVAVGTNILTVTPCP